MNYTTFTIPVTAILFLFGVWLIKWMLERRDRQRVWDVLWCAFCWPLKSEYLTITDIIAMDNRLSYVETHLILTKLEKKGLVERRTIAYLPAFRLRGDV